MSDIQALRQKLADALRVQAEATLDPLGITVADGPTADALAAIHEATTALEAEAIDLKREEQEIKERKREVRAKWDDLVSARSYLYSLRPSQPGDVTVQIGN